jgi:hypothetical protein
MILDHPALFEAKQDDIRVIGRQEAALLGGRRNRRSRAVVDLHEDPVELRPAMLAPVDAERHSLAQTVELSDLHRRPERPGA